MISFEIQLRRNLFEKMTALRATCYFCNVDLDEYRRDVTSCCGKYIHLECATRFLGKECKCCNYPWSKEAVRLFRNYIEWIDVKNLTSGNQARVRRTIAAIDHVDEFYYKWMVIDKWGRESVAHDHEDLWMTFR